MKKSIIVVEDFYEDTNKILDIASTFTYKTDINFYKGYRSEETYKPTSLFNTIQDLIQQDIDKDSWNKHPNACFQLTTAEDPIVYHMDSQRWAGVLYLSPFPRLESGTKTYINKIDGCTHSSSMTKDTFKRGNYDSTQFDVVDSIGNIFNRLVLFDGKKIHSAGPYWGNDIVNGRLVQLFFFNTTDT